MNDGKIGGEIERLEEHLVCIKKELLLFVLVIKSSAKKVKLLLYQSFDMSLAYNHEMWFLMGKYSKTGFKMLNWASSVKCWAEPYKVRSSLIMGDLRVDPTLFSIEIIQWKLFGQLVRRPLGKIIRGSSYKSHSSESLGKTTMLWEATFVLWKPWHSPGWARECCWRKRFQVSPPGPPGPVHP